MDNLKKIVAAAIKQAEISDISTKSQSSQANEIVSFVCEHMELFHNNNKDIFTLDKKTNVVRRLNGRQFLDWLTASYYEKTNKSIRDQSLREALSTLSGLGRYKGKLQNAHVRIAQHGNNYYLDLCQPENSKVVKLSIGHWEIIESAPVRFVRSETMQPLPDPVHGGDLFKLKEICNIPETSFLLAIAWLAEALRPDTPFPVLELLGEQGSAKSTTQTVLRRIIDPNSCDLRSTPKSPEDVFVGSSINHILSYENVSHLSHAMQDAFCIIATGGGYAKRKLYSDSDEIVIQAKNPIITNGIAAIITAQDLIDRTITIELPIIQKRTETPKLWFIFEQSHPYILGGLLDVVANALALLPTTNLPAGENPRLIEFVRFGMAIAKAMNLSGNDFLYQFTASRQEAIARTIDASPVASALIEWFEHQGKTECVLSTKDLFIQVERYRPQGTDAWPKSAKGFGDSLRRAAPALRQLNIECKCLGKQGSFVKWQISEKDNSSKQSLECLDVTEKDIKTFKTSNTLIPSDDYEEF
ncbi:hypothetical protein [Legionella sainthelensi]|uniref:hypothetical protein n=1 Tax=Legionella sainthelensi TaxID=28087 RepID=UPI000E202F68|nr:hypothetical protein [Legionella sainthelensi]